MKKITLISALLLSTSVTQAAVEEEMIVTGMRQSLTQSMDIKRESSGVVDAISSEDIGKMPDSNLAESLQRITGVSIDRTRGEGDQVTVRGFGPAFNLVTLNGRQMPSVSSPKSDQEISRNFSFRNIAAESVSGVEVFKSGFAGAPSGGIGATINLKTARPLEIDNAAVISAKALGENDNFNPEFGMMLSGVQSLGAYGALGVMVSLSDSERKYHEKSTGANWHWGTAYPGPSKDAYSDAGWINPSWNPEGLKWSTAEFGISDSNYKRDRSNSQATIQYAPLDSLTITYDRVNSDVHDRGDMARASYWLDEYDKSTADTNGTLTQVRSDNETVVFWAWEYNYRTKNNSDGLNIAWEASDRLSLEFDFHDSTAHANPGLLPAERLSGGDIMKPGAVAGIETRPVVVTGHFDTPLTPYAEFHTDLENGAFDWGYFEPGHYQERGFELKNHISQSSFKGEFEIDAIGFHTLNFGFGEIVNTLDVTELLETNFGLGTPQGDTHPNTRMDISELQHEEIDGWAGFDVIHAWDPSEFIDLVDQQGLDADNHYNVDYDEIEEVTKSAFASISGEWGILKATGGLRYEETDVSVTSSARPVAQLHYSTNAQLDRMRGPYQTNHASGAYSEWLPSLDISLHFDNDIVIRGAASNTISRSSLGALYPADIRIKDVRVHGSQAQQGNPALKPYRADNLDLSAEWYYSEGSYLSLGSFWKSVDNFISTEATQEYALTSQEGVLTNPSARETIESDGCPTIVLLDDPQSPCLSRDTDPKMPVIVARSKNQKRTDAYGLELNLQHLFGESGFGVIANYTLVKSGDTFDPKSLDNSFALSGLSDTANLIAFYDNYGFQARLAYNWRDKFYAGASPGSANYVEPIFVAEYDQIDAQISYQINDSVRVFVEGINLTNEKTHSHGRFDNQIYSLAEYAPRYSIGVSASLF